MKKTLKNIGYKISFLCMCMMMGIYSYASTDSLASQSYNTQTPSYFDPLHHGPLRFILMGLVVAAMIFVTFRYWKLASMGRDIWHDPQ